MHDTSRGGGGRRVKNTKKKHVVTHCPFLRKDGIQSQRVRKSAVVCAHLYVVVGLVRRWVRGTFVHVRRYSKLCQGTPVGPQSHCTPIVHPATPPKYIQICMSRICIPLPRRSGKLEVMMLVGSWGWFFAVRRGKKIRPSVGLRQTPSSRARAGQRLSVTGKKFYDQLLVH